MMGIPQCAQRALSFLSSFKKSKGLCHLLFFICLFSACIYLQGNSGKLSLVNSSTEITEISSQKKKLQTCLRLLVGIYCVFI